MVPHINPEYWPDRASAEEGEIRNNVLPDGAAAFLTAGWNIVRPLDLGIVAAEDVTGQDGHGAVYLRYVLEGVFLNPGSARELGGIDGLHGAYITYYPEHDLWNNIQNYQEPENDFTRRLKPMMLLKTTSRPDLVSCLDVTVGVFNLRATGEHTTEDDIAAEGIVPYDQLEEVAGTAYAIPELDNELPTIDGGGPYRIFHFDMAAVEGATMAATFGVDTGRGEDHAELA